MPLGVQGDGAQRVGDAGSWFRRLLDVDPERRKAIEAIARELVPGRSVALSTHVNSDGDGCGSEVALARLLMRRGLQVRIVNPTPWPETFRFLLTDDVAEMSGRGAAALQGVDALIVLDISEVGRLGGLADAVRALRVPRLVIDHHVPGAEPAGDIMLTDVTACATGELVFDLAAVLDMELDEQTARALYAALLTDTGGFRFSNTTPRCHAIAGQLLAAGVHPEEMYRRIYATVSVGRLQLLRDALDTIGVDAAHGLTWMSIRAGALERYDVRSEELDGLAEHPRSIAGTRMAIFFRDLGHGQVKISFRSTGNVDVNAFARRFGGGGHAKAAGALVPGDLGSVQERVLAAAREFLA